MLEAVLSKSKHPHLNPSSQWIITYIEVVKCRMNGKRTKAGIVLTFNGLTPFS